MQSTTSETSKILTIGLLTLWVLGGICVILFLARKEQKRLGGRLFEKIGEDIQEQPIAATLGYTFFFLASWMYFVQFFMKGFSSFYKTLTSQEKRNVRSLSS